MTPALDELKVNATVEAIEPITSTQNPSIVIAPGTWGIIASLENGMCAVLWNCGSRVIDDSVSYGLAVTLIRPLPGRCSH